MTRTKPYTMALLGLTAAAVLAACNNGNVTGGNPMACGTPSGVTQGPVLVYPAPGATAVPDAFGQIVVASNVAMPNTWDVAVYTAAGGGATGAGFQAASPPFPTPNASPTFANPVYQSSSFVGTDIPGSTVAVYLNELDSNCTPSVEIGTFTTQ